MILCEDMKPIEHVLLHPIWVHSHQMWACKLVPSPRGDFGSWPPQTKLQAPPNWNMTHYKPVEFLSVFRMSSPPEQTHSLPTETQSPLLKTFWRRFWCKHCNIKFIIERIEVADEFVTSENPDLTRVFIIKPRHPGRLKKQTWVEKNRSGSPGHIRKN